MSRSDSMPAGAAASSTTTSAPMLCSASSASACRIDVLRTARGDLATLPRQDARDVHHSTAFACSRRTYFWIFPVEVFGSGPNTTARGTLKCARCSRHHAMMSPPVIGGASGLSVTNAQGVSPHFGIRLRHHRGLHDGGVPVEDLLDLERRDVLAAGDDDVLRAVLDLDVAVRVPHRQVAGVEPAAAERLLGGRGIPEVPLHHACCRAASPRPCVAPSRGTGASVTGSATMSPSSVG